MRVLVGTTLFDPGAGGKENYLDQLLRGLAARGHETRCLARFDDAAAYEAGRLRFDRDPAHAGSDRVEPIRAAASTRPLRRFLGPMVVRPRLARLAARLAAAAYAPALVEAARWSDVVHWDGIGFELVGWAFLRSARRAGRPLVVVGHLHVGRWGDGPLDLAFYRQADAVVAKTPVEAAFLQRAGVGRVQVIGNGPVVADGADGEAFRRRRGLDERPVVLFLGRKVPEKGFDVFCEAARLVRAARPRVACLAAGPGDGGSTAAGSGIEDLGYLDEREKASALAACDVLCVPSPVEAFGMAYLEAWSFGKPVVAGGSPQVQALVEDGVDGFAVAGPPADVAGALVKLVDDPGLARSMGERGRAKVEAAHGWDAVVDATIDLYREVAAR